MRPYGVNAESFYGDRIPQQRASYERSNRGRARASAEPRNRARGALAPFNPTWVRRTTKKKARRIGKEEIAGELHLLWLDKEVDRIVHSDNSRKFLDDYLDYYYYMGEETDENDYEPLEPTSKAWLYMWINGLVHDDQVENELDWDYDRYRYEYEDDFDEVYNIIDWDEVNGILSSNEGPAGRIRADSERNKERLRAGERYFHENKRTVSK